MRFSFVLFCCFNGIFSFAQNAGPWHGFQRKVHYKPDGEDFLLVKGSRRFNRALYGGNTAFRVEAGDLPEFALYLPGMGGNLKFGLIKNDQSKWLTDADSIETRYRAGSMVYRIKDRLLGKATLVLTVLSLFDKEGLIMKLEANEVADNVQLIAAYGGASGQKFSRDGDVGADPESSFYLKPEYCTDNVYSINKNQFTVFFGSKKPLTEEERYEIQNFPSQKTDSINRREERKTIYGIFPLSSQLKTADASQQLSPAAFYQSASSSSPAMCAQMKLENGSNYFFIKNGKPEEELSYDDLLSVFRTTEEHRAQLAGRIKLYTPDPYINTLGGALSMAADAIWEDPSYLHGAVAWRMRLNGWRGAYAADVLGWHDRAEKHFSSYALSQITTPRSGAVVMDTALHLARGMEKLGTSLFNSGYISRNPNGDLRPHHYDMNLVFIDQLLNHFYWTSDTPFLRKTWPLLVRHLDWEKRNFDRDGDGLYDAYAAIWASDALQYSGGGVTHSSAYNYKANLVAAQLAKTIGEDGGPCQKEAGKILKAMNDKLWLKDRGWFAEYKDLLGNQLVHPAAGLWTIYHAIDSHVPDAFQTWQMLKYVDANIPHIPIKAEGLDDSSLYALSTTNWQPYTWSLNNVALAELLHTALAYWQGGRNEEAYTIWKSALVESMYLGASPGNFQQLSFYDAMRGELYRDFADDIGMASRSLIEGLFGIEPDLLHDTLYIRPGFPESWDHASINTPDIEYEFQSKANTDRFIFISHFPKAMHLSLEIGARSDNIEYVLVNGNKVLWTIDVNAVGRPVVKINAATESRLTIEVKWKGNKFEKPVIKKNYAKGDIINLMFERSVIAGVFDPQKAVTISERSTKKLRASTLNDSGVKTFFVKLKQGSCVYWLPISFNAVKPLELSWTGSDGSKGKFSIQNHTSSEVSAKVIVGQYEQTVRVNRQSATSIEIPLNELVAGTNLISLYWKNQLVRERFINWDKRNGPSAKYEKLDLSSYFNDQVNNIFKNQYLSPRPSTTALQLPTQGIGNWAYPLTTVNINDSGLRKRAGVRNEILIQQGIPFETASQPNANNIVFTSQWDNYPKQISIPLKGRSSHAYFLMAGSTNPMQSRMVNGEIVVEYQDHTADTLSLKNPENWWPIEQDYYEDGYAFTTGAVKPVRVYLKTGEDSREFKNFITIRGFSNRGIDGGAATVVDLPLDPSKELKSLHLKAIANDVVIGLMSVTLVR